MSALSEFKRLSGRLFLNGEFVSSQSSEHLDIIEPATEDSIGHIADATD